MRFDTPLALPLYILIEEGLVAGKFLSIWKNAFVIRLHDNGSKSAASDYRPITLVPIPCNLLEKLKKEVFFLLCS